MSFGGGGGSNTNTIQQNEPYAPAQPALNQIISEAGAIYGAGPAAAGYVAPSTQTLQGLATQETMANAANQQIISPGQKIFCATDGTSWYPLETSSSTWRTISATTGTVFAGENIFVDTSSNTVNITLPGTPPVGSEIRFLDLADNFDTNALTITPTGSDKVFGAASAGTVSTEGAAFSLVYTGASYGWKLTEK